MNKNQASKPYVGHVPMVVDKEQHIKQYNKDARHVLQLRKKHFINIADWLEIILFTYMIF